MVLMRFLILEKAGSLKAAGDMVDLQHETLKETLLLRAAGEMAHLPEDSGQGVFFGERTGQKTGAGRTQHVAGTVEGSDACNVGLAEVPCNNSIEMPLLASKCGEKRVGGVLATAMRKYAVPKSSCYHGVTKLKWSGKYEAHLWDNTSRVEGVDGRANMVRLFGTVCCL
ncbi:hypothetical protein HPP92_013068 [Vanilla planifolia]|uniref:Uncharacterized protein n=1 Tax=Vanilla planifolia TaxID=51239 RepID=A0A835UW46_VANPL|nr:hypothetical protein HPP92_013068 [Vanilla planifolia]